MANNYSNLQFNQQNQTQMPSNTNTMPLPMTPPQYSMQQYFPQPQGNIFMINNSSEIGNVPISNGISAGICLAEGVMYLKTMQNGSPAMLSYRLSPLEGPMTNEQNNFEETNKKIIEYLKNYNERLTKIEEVLGKTKEANGGKLEWPL